MLETFLMMYSGLRILFLLLGDFVFKFGSYKVMNKTTFCLIKECG